MSRTHNSSNDNSILDNNTMNVNIVNNASTVESQNELPVTEFPQPVITRIPQSHNNRSLAQILNEIPPPPYHTTDSNMQFPSPYHSRDNTTITFPSPPEYTTITTQPQPRVMSHPSNHNTNDDDALLDSSQQLKFCKICQESDDSDSSSSARDEEEYIVVPEPSYNKGKLISPCKCKGSLQYVHIGCLNKWRNSNVRLEASYRCEVCRYEYRFYRPRIAKIFSSNFTLHILSLTLLLSIIYLSSYIVKLLLNHNNDVPPPPHLPGKDKNEWRDITFLNIRIIEFIIGISLVSCFGLIFFIFMICCNGFSYTRQHFCYCGGCDGCSGCGYGMYGGSDCSGGDCGGIVILFLLIIILVIFVLGFSGAIIAAYLFIQKITTICLEKVHDRILEVKKD